MKTYIKPVAEIREFEATNKLASLQSWLDQNADTLAVSGVSAEAITSYYMNS